MADLKVWADDLAIVARREIIKASLYGVIGLAAVVVGSGALGHFVPILKTYGVWLGVLAGSAASLTYLSLRSRLSKFTPPLRALICDFTIVEKEVSYTYKTRTDLKYEKRVKIRALRSGLTQLHDKFSWTGRGTMVVRSLIHDQHYLETVRKSIWQLYSIQLNKTLVKKEMCETRLLWDLVDDGKAVPFVSATIEVPTEILIIKVQIDPSLGVRRVACEESLNIALETAIHSTTEVLDEEGRFSWVIKNPKLLHYYELRWAFPDTNHEHKTDPTATTR